MSKQQPILDLYWQCVKEAWTRSTSLTRTHITFGLLVAIGVFLLSWPIRGKPDLIDVGIAAGALVFAWLVMFSCHLVRAPALVFNAQRTAIQTLTEQAAQAEAGVKSFRDAQQLRAAARSLAGGLDAAAYEWEVQMGRDKAMGGEPNLIYMDQQLRAAVTGVAQRIRASGWYQPAEHIEVFLDDFEPSSPEDYVSKMR